MNQRELMEYLLRVVEQQGLRYAIAGAHASIVFGEARFTSDIDVVVALTPETLKAFCDAFPPPDFYVSEDGARYAAAHGGMFNIIYAANCLKIDVIVPATEFDRGQLGRAVRAPVFIGTDALFVSPEDQIIKKMEYYREGGSEKHLRDIAGILKTSGRRIDQSYLTSWAEKLGLVEIWKSVLSSATKEPEK